MNAADTALAAGWVELRYQAGETLTFRGNSVSVVIDWEPAIKRGSFTVRSGIPDRAAKTETAIEIDPSQFSGSEPRVGESFTGGGKTHRIQSVTHLGDNWLCTCEVSP